MSKNRALKLSAVSVVENIVGFVVDLAFLVTRSSEFHDEEFLMRKTGKEIEEFSSQKCT